MPVRGAVGLRSGEVGLHNSHVENGFCIRPALEQSPPNLDAFTNRADPHHPIQACNNAGRNDAAISSDAVEPAESRSHSIGGGFETYQEGAPWDVLRWREAPKFYFKTVDQRGRPLERDVVAYIRDAITRAVPAYTGGQYAASIETGTETRPDTAGWINVLVRYDRSERSTCGLAYVGRDPGEITLIINDVCSCGSVKVPRSVVLHEVGHALGFFHVPDKRSVMYPWAPGNCPSGTLSPTERYHAAIAYRRPRGNSDPDNDPSSGRLFSPGSVDGPREHVRN